MEDTSIPPHSTGNGQPHQNPVNHTRPFFYVQPPSPQLYYYQWQYNNPYGNYGAFPGPGVPFGRPYVAPYPYLTCPGYIVPHAPMQPIDYRRMFNPHLSPGTASDARFQQQARVHRETASSETQTEARDAVSKLMVRLDRLRVSVEASEENELDSGVVSQTSGMFLHSGQAPPREEQREDPEPECPAAEVELGGELSPPSAMPFGRSTAARCLAGSSPGCMGELFRSEVWSVGVEGVLPLDSSSQNEESDGEQVPDDSARFAAPEKQHPASGQSECPRSYCEENKENCGAGIQPVCKPLSPQSHDEATPERLPSAHPAIEDLGPRGAAPCPEKAGMMDVQEEPVHDTENLSYRILRLPCDEVTTGGMLRRDDPLWPIEAQPCVAPILPPAGYLPSFGDGFLYSYYPSVAPERQSVLSPSLDELSSRDDMFSTDVEDVESVSGRAYVGDRASAQAVEGASDTGDEDEDEGDRWEEDEERPVPETRLCTACGSCLNGDSRRGKSTGTGPRSCPENNEEVVEEEVEDCNGYDDEDEDDRLKEACESWEVPVRKCPARHTQPPCVPRLKLKNGYSSELLAQSGLEEQEWSYPRGPKCCEGHGAPNKPDKSKGPNLKSAQSRPRTDRPQGGDRVATGQEYWESCGNKPRPKFWRLYPSSRGKVRPPRRRGGCKTFVPQRFRREYNEEEEEEEEEGEFQRFHRGRGSTKRRGARY